MEQRNLPRPNPEYFLTQLEDQLLTRKLELAAARANVAALQAVIPTIAEAILKTRHEFNLPFNDTPGKD